MTLIRRRALVLGAAALPLVLSRHPAMATPAKMAAAIDGFTGGGVPTEGRVTLDIPLLVENGNSVPMTVAVDSPMTETDFVTDIAVFNEKNPLPEVVHLRLTPAMGLARLQTRIRLSNTQQITAIARMNEGSLWSASMTVIVTAPACVES